MNREALASRLEALRAALSAGRCTVRLDAPKLGCSVNTPFVEALAPGMRSMMGDASIDHRRARSIRWIERARRTLVQGDVFADPEMAPPAALARDFGTSAQLVGPLIGADDYLVGWLSAHFRDGPRVFSQHALDLFERERADIEKLLRQHEETAR